MLPGPNQIIACPYCGALAHYTTLMSGNTFGAKLYSDGKQISPHMPQPPPYVECTSCQELYWLKDAAEVGTIPWNCADDDEGYKPAWVAAPLVQAPREERFYESIERLAANGPTEELRQLRILAWHKRNDAYREIAEIPIVLSPVARKNMQDLSIEMGNGGKKGSQVSLGDGLMIAELFREQEHFEFALDFLTKNVWHDLQTFADQLSELCRQKNCRVVELFGT